MIKFDGVTKKFGRLKALDNVSLHCERGECIALIGPNACGKTTLIKSFLGMVVPDQGDILYDGKSILNEVSYRMNIGYMPQIGRYPQNMSIGQVMEMVRELRGSGTGTDDELLKAYELDKIWDKPMGTLSGGTIQKVSATLAFLFSPETLILDEPTAGLDPLASEILKQKIMKEREMGKLVLITSHLLNELDELISQVIFMQEGRILFHQKVGQLKEETGEERLSKVIAGILKKAQG